MCKKLIYLIVLVLGVSAGVTNADIIAYWPFDEGTGGVAFDVIGGFDAQLSNVDWVAGQFSGSALECDRSGDEILPGPGPTPTTQDLSIAWWMMDADDNTYETVMNKYESDSTAGNGILLRPPGEADVLIWRLGGFQAYGGWGVECSVPEGTYSRGEWVHFVCTYDSATDTATIYANGVLVPNETNKNPKTGIAGPTGYCEGVNDPAQPLYIVGQREGFGGIVDEVAIWDQALTPDEVLAVYTLGPLALDPRKASKPSPDDEATDVPRDVVLSWTPGESANTHNVYLGTVFEDVNEAVLTDAVSTGQADATYDPPGRLDFAQTYYWRVDEVNAPPDSTIFKGTTWSFTAEPFAYPIENITATASSSDQDQGPENTVNGSGLDVNDLDLHSDELTDMWLSATGAPGPAWIQYDFDKVYKLAEMRVWNQNGRLEPVIGFGARDVTVEYSTDGTDFTTLGTTHEFARAPGAAGYAANTAVDFAGAAAKHVRLTVNSNWGGILPQYGLSEVQFFSPPVFAREPSPDSGAIDVGVVDLNLSWRAGREADKHDVYLNTDEQAVIDGTAPVTTVTEAGYAPSVDLGETYYWRVDEVNDAETTTTWQGDIWSLSTQEYRVVDDFESYNDIATGEEGSNLIYETWIDGFDNPSVNGSTMGHTVPFEPSTEGFIVFDGSQSAPLYYDNSTASLSEVTANTSDLAVGRDWTTGSPQTLALWVHGALENTPQQMYVKVGSAKVLYEGDITLPMWRQWNIDLAGLGINLTNVTQLSIGLERIGATGSSGMVLVDAIRLYGQAPLLPSEEIWIEAEAATAIIEPFKTFDDATALAGKYIGTVEGDGDPATDPPNEATGPGLATYNFTVAGGTYKIWLRVIIPPGNNNSFWVHVPGATYNRTVSDSGWIVMNDIPDSTEWYWKDVHSSDDGDQSVEFTLAPGSHTLLIGHREELALLDAIVITSDVD